MNRSALSHGYRIFETDVPVDELYDSSSPCKWSDSWAGIKTDHPLAERWYESIVNLFAEWGVDFIKYDDLIDPDNYAEIVLIHNAIEKCGREMVLSLSPGNKCVTKDAEFYSAHSSMWRISGDYWDNWDPQTKRSFRLLAQWNPYIDNPGWPDADMLPLGRICEVASVHGDVPRDCRLNEQEQHSLMTLFSIAKSPLFLTCNLLKNEKRYFQIQTNRDCIAVNQNGRNPRVLWNDEKMQIWTSYVQNRGYLAIFNLFDETAVLSFELPQEYIGKEFTEVWTGKKVKFGQKKADLKIKAHDVFFLRENMDSDID